MRQTNRAGVNRPLLYAVVILLVGLAYRATFITQGFAATDEGWLQSLGYRIAHGQLPYRDFDYALPPLSIYKEAALIKIFGDAYGVLASRWAFVVLATIGSLLTFLIIRRYVGDRVAFLTALPTVFFSVILYYFSNYNYDSLVLLLAAIAFLVYAQPGRRWFPLLAGVAAGLSLLAKPTYGAFLVAVVVAGLVAPRLPGLKSETVRGLRQWPLVLLGAAIPVLVVVVAVALAGASRQFFYQAFLLYRAAHPGSLLGLIVQGIPGYVTRPAGLIGAVLAVLLVLSPRQPALRWVRIGAVIVGLAAVLLLTVAVPDRAQPAFLVAGFECLWLINLVALVSGLRGGLPSPELPLFALALQYLSQITYNGVVLYYVGAYLTVPVALMFLLKTPSPTLPTRGREELQAPTLTLPREWGREELSTPSLTLPTRGRELVALLVGLWLVVGSVIVTRMNVYEDAPRAQLTSAFTSAKLQGISSLPTTTQRIDAAVSAVNRLSRPGEPVFAFPDLAILYFLTNRTNPTRVDWYNTGSITPDEVTQAVADLTLNPPRVVLLQSYRESDFQRSEQLDYVSEPKWLPIIAYLMSHYRQVGQAGDITVMVPAG
jgi:hypothetical protein